MKSLRLFALVAFMHTMSFASVFGEVLTIKSYLKLLEEHNPELKSIQSNIDAVEGKLAEIERVYSYYLNADTSFSDNSASGLQETVYNLGLNKQFATGTQVTLGFAAKSGNYKTSYVNQADYSLSVFTPTLQLQQSLFKNLNGAMTKASIEKAKAEAKSTLHSLKYQKQYLLFQAKNAYWNLSYRRRLIDFRKTSLERARKILDWNAKRYKLDLAEKTDLLQSQAAVKMGELNLKLAYEDEIKADRLFNQFLNVTLQSDKKFDVIKFNDVEKTLFNKIEIKDVGIRLDILASLEKIHSAEFERLYHKKNSGADLVLVGEFDIYNVNQKVKNFTDQQSDGSGYSVGFQWSVPLDFKIREIADAGYLHAVEAAQQDAKAIALLAKNEWLELVDNWNNAKKRLSLVAEIEEIQRTRNEEDKNLLRRGRSTTYLVLQGEQDLDNATLNVLTVVLELMTLREQAETLYNNPESGNVENLTQ
ncbi:MAG: TolC family protein [Elusimicrobiota bacterium]|jgi:outer membrane protein TolC|nr:TolC family protein [Elusimicrobiota bacterium]